MTLFDASECNETLGRNNLCNSFLVPIDLWPETQFARHFKDQVGELVVKVKAGEETLQSFQLDYFVMRLEQRKRRVQCHLFTLGRVINFREDRLDLGSVGTYSMLDNGEDDFQV